MDNLNWDEWAFAKSAAIGARNYMDELRLAKANYNDDAEDIEDLGEHGVLGQFGYGGLGPNQPRNVPQRRPVSSSGRGASELTRESSDVRPGDASVQAAHLLGRQLAEARATLKSFRRALTEILDDEDLGETEANVNQRRWPEGEPDEQDVLSGKAMYRTNVSGMLRAVGGGGLRNLPIEALAKSTGAIGARIEAAADAGDLTLVEQIACSSILGMIEIAKSNPNVRQALVERLATTEPRIRDLFGLG